MITVSQFKNLLGSVIDILQGIVNDHSAVAGQMFAGAVTVFRVYETPLIEALKQKGILKP